MWLAQLLDQRGSKPLRLRCGDRRHLRRSRAATASCWLPAAAPAQSRRTLVPPIPGAELTLARRGAGPEAHGLSCVLTKKQATPVHSMRGLGSLKFGAGRRSRRMCHGQNALDQRDHAEAAASRWPMLVFTGPSAAERLALCAADGVSPAWAPPLRSDLPRCRARAVSLHVPDPSWPGHPRMTVRHGSPCA